MLSSVSHGTLALVNASGLDGRPVFDATPIDVEHFLARYTTAQTRYSMRSDLHKFYRWAIRHGLTTSDPTDQVDPPRLPHRLPTPIPAPLVRSAINNADGSLRTAIMLAAHAGLRVSEIAALTAEDIDPSVIVVRGGKGATDRVVPCAAVLARQLTVCPPPLPWRDGHSVSTAIRRHLRRLGIPGRPHDLRASFATEAARVSGGNVVLVQQLLGHVSLSTTQRYMGWHPVGAGVVEQLFAA